MAKYERYFQGNFDAALRQLHNGILSGSATASFEDGSDFSAGEFRCAVRVYERYSATGGNRLSASVTLAGKGENLFLSVITAGGSQGILFKINLFGEEAFLNAIREIAERL
ncbi:MAG: hypothetical protein HFG00_08010 [Oscillibacter sp.]|nr:hypothetical protein [Oscillibacter sp.]